MVSAPHSASLSEEMEDSRTKRPFLESCLALCTYLDHESLTVMTIYTASPGVSDIIG